MQKTGLNTTDIIDEDHNVVVALLVALWPWSFGTQLIYCQTKFLNEPEGPGSLKKLRRAMEELVMYAPSIKELIQQHPHLDKWAII